jgi:chemotaxis response regulator CheB
MLRGARFCGALRLGNDIARNAFMTATRTLHSSTAMRVLLVDDSKTERRLAERALAQDGFDVVTADSAQAALLALDGAGFNLIISDQRLRDLPGVALLGMVRETVVPAPPMLLLTSDDSARTRHAASHAGVCRVLTKPVAPGSLRDVVIAIGASTGGVEALFSILKALPADCPPILVVQHMPAAFTAGFASRLDKECAMRVVEAVDGTPIAPGTVYIAPGGHAHMELVGGAHGFSRPTPNNPRSSARCPSAGRRSGCGSRFLSCR